MSNIDGRQFERREAAHATTCLSNGGVCSVAICNISEGGCLVEGEDLTLRHGARTRIRIEGICMIEGTVAWAGEGRGGIAFDEPLHGAVVLHIALSTSARPGADDPPRDRFGRILPPPAYPPRFSDMIGA
ncbi:PilZ domain-containing protein [Tsuneonella amylolytica]|uniref:PilZ domain-containing protein n=1 Tax=Tsuneonella amylolytica TaxID=2338327 RepID=UPI0013C468C5|nr:PilZ domain-containing protein [Tsuneonella amylolytica]